MRPGASAALTVLALLAAGCAGPAGDETYTCPDGTVLQLDQIGDGHDHGADDAAGHCPVPTPPSVSLVGTSFNATIHHEASITWQVSNGSYAGGHSMFNGVRLAHHPTPLDGVAKKEDYGIMDLAFREHQDLPVGPFTGTFTLTTPGTFYLRAYARIYADGLPEKEYWSDEVALKVADIKATGTVVTVTHAVGDFAGGLDEDTVNLQPGDAFLLKNDDVRDHTYTFQNGPPGGGVGDVVVKSMASSGAVLLKVPGTYTWESDDLQPETLTVNVAVPSAKPAA